MSTQAWCIKHAVSYERDAGCQQCLSERSEESKELLEYVLFRLRHKDLLHDLQVKIDSFLVSGTW